MDAKQYSRCIEILAELNNKLYSKEDKGMLLELGYLIKQNKVGGKDINVAELIEDNKRLYQENQTMISNVLRMKEIVNTKIGEIATILDGMRNKYNYIKDRIEELKKSVE